MSFREWQLGNQYDPANITDAPPGTEKPSGGLAVAQLNDKEFIVFGQHARLRIDGAGANAGKNNLYARVEEGHFDGAGKWVMERNWNGDQTDQGLNFTGQPIILKIKMGSY